MLFADLESQLAAEEEHDRRAEVADRTRRERALLDVPARLLANVGTRLALRTATSVHEGELVEVGADWLLLQPGVGRQVLVPLRAVRAVTGLQPGTTVPGVVSRRLALGAALRRFCRDRAAVEVVDLGGFAHIGTIDSVGADHLELAEHPRDEPRRAGNVRAVHLVPFEAVSAVTRFGSAPP